MKVRNFALSADVIAYVRNELYAYRRNEPLTCAILRHEGQHHTWCSALLAAWWRRTNKATVSRPRYSTG